MPKHFSCLFHYTLTLFLPFTLWWNTFLDIPVISKHFFCYFNHAKTPFLSFPLCQNTFLAISDLPKYLFMSYPYINTLYLVTPGNAWLPPGNTWSPLDHHLVTTWSPPGNTWQHLITSNWKIPLFKLYYKKVPLTKVFHTSMYPAQIRTMHYQIWPQHALKISVW